jgi:hypothetical protein
VKSYYDTTTGHARYTATPPPLPLPVCVHKFVCDATILCHVTTPPPWKPSPSFCGRNAAAGGLTMCKGELPGHFPSGESLATTQKIFLQMRGESAGRQWRREHTCAVSQSPGPRPSHQRVAATRGDPPLAPSLPFWGGGGGPHRVMTFQFPPTRLPKKKLVFFGQGEGRPTFVFRNRDPPHPRAGTAGPGAPVALGHRSPQRGNHCTCSCM